MPKPTMTDEQIRALMGRVSEWLRESDARAAKNASAMRKGGKVKIPKRPVKTSGTKTVPAKLNWGKGVTKDKLAYINSDEEAMLRERRGDLPVRKVKGIPAFAEETVGPGGGGSGGGGKGGAGGAGGGASAGASSSNTGGGGGSSGSKSSTTDDKKASSGPSRGPTDAPAAVGSSKPSAPAAPAGNSFGPRSGSVTGTAAKDPTKSVSAQASKIAAETALKNVAAGSIANPSTGRSPKDTGRVPGVDAQMKNSDALAGANSPLADAGTPSYDRTAMDKLNADAAAAKAAKASQYSGLQPVGQVGYTDAQKAAMYGGSKPVDKALTVAQDALSAPPVKVNMEKLPNAPKQYADRLPGSVPVANLGPSKLGQTVVGMDPASPSKAAAKDDVTAKLAAEAMWNVFSGAQTTRQTVAATTPAVTPASAAPTTAKEFSNPVTDRLSMQTEYGTITPDVMAALAPADQARLNAVAQTPTFVGVPSTVGRAPSVSLSSLADPNAPRADYSSSIPGADIGRFDTASNIMADDIRSGQLTPDTPTYRGVGPATTPVSGATVPGRDPAAARASGLAGAETAPVAPGVSPGAREPADVAQGPQVATSTTSPTVPGAPAAPSAYPAAVQTPTTPVTPSVNPSQQPAPTWTDKLENKFAAVDKAMTPTLDKVDNFLTSVFGVASPTSAYSRMMEEAAAGSKRPEDYPRNGMYSSSGIGGGFGGGGGGNKTVGKVNIPDLPPYVNYQNMNVGNGQHVVLPAPSKPITDFIDEGYARGGAIPGMFGGLGAAAFSASPRGGISARSMGDGNAGGGDNTGGGPPGGSNNGGGSGTGGGWNLGPITPPGGNGPPGGSASSPNGNYYLDDHGNIARNYGNMSEQEILQDWWSRQVKGMDGKKGVLPNFGDLWGALIRHDQATGDGFFSGNNSGNGNGNVGIGGGGNNNGNGNGSGNADSLTGAGKPGAWSGTLNGWARGGTVNDSVAAALRLARMMYP